MSKNAPVIGAPTRGAAVRLAADLKTRLTRTMRRTWVIAVFVLGWAGHAHTEPVLHEYFDFTGKKVPAPQWRATNGSNADARTQAAISPGDNNAPYDLERTLPDDPAEANGAVIPGNTLGDRSEAAPDSRGTATAEAVQRGDTGRYRLDGNTSTPSLVGYSDPFSPSIPPFKRLFAYDSVNENLELVVARATLTQVGVGGGARPSDDQFFAEVQLVSKGDQPQRLPTVGAGFRILSSKVSSNQPFLLQQDSAENLFVRGLPPGSITWTAHLAIDRRTFGSPFPEVHWSTLRPYLPELPPVVAAAAAPVLGKAGVTTSQRPAQALRRLVQYFRSFSPEEKLYTSTGVQLYHDISLSQQGVCRHRAFAFVVTALALGLPSRFVRNEAHAWVEVFDGKLWHRLDLGGAASDVALSGELNSPHQPPADPYAWPSTGESGQSMVARALGAGAPGQSSSSPGAAVNKTPSQSGSALQTGQNSTGATTPGAAAEPQQSTQIPDDAQLEGEQTEPTEAQRPTTLAVQFGGATLKRGERFSLSGTARQTTGESCALMRIEVTLVEQTSQATFGIGTLVTDNKGKYGGELVVPNRVPVGDYRINVKTPGNQTCAPATAQ